MFKITFFFLVLINSVQQIARNCCKRFWQVWAKYNLWERVHENIQLTLLWLCERWVNSEQASRLLHVWNHFIFPFSDRFRV